MQFVLVKIIFISIFIFLTCQFGSLAFDKINTLSNKANQKIKPKDDIYAGKIFFAKETVNNVAEAGKKEQNNKVGEQRNLDLKAIEKFFTALEITQTKYIEADKVSTDALVEMAIDGMLRELDPHCSLMRDEDLKNFTDEANDYQGIGITVGIQNRQLFVLTLHEGGPAARAGVLAGDQIIQINKNQITPLTSYVEILQLLSGEPGQIVNLTIQRSKKLTNTNEKLPERVTEKLQFSIMREVINHGSVRNTSFLNLEPKNNLEQDSKFNIGYIRILQFTHSLTSEFLLALDKLERQKKIHALIIDLRNNPGGVVESAVQICSIFMRPNKLVTTLEGRSEDVGITSYNTYKLKNVSENRYKKLPLAVLVNNSSASSSELMAAALQDHKRASIIGEKTFGKGSVQNVIKLPNADGLYLRLTVAKYFSPKRHEIHGKGVAPDLEVEMPLEDFGKLQKLWNSKNLSEEERKELQDFEDPQLRTAFDKLIEIINES